MTDEIATMNLPATLPALAADIRQHHEAGRRDAIAMAEHWLEAGRLLIEAKAQIPHGGWAGWLETNVGFSDRGAALRSNI